MALASRKIVRFIVLCGFLAFADGRLAPRAAETAWPGLRGPSHDGAVRDARLVSGAGQPALKTAWKKPLGSGYSGVSVSSGRVVTLFASGAADVAAAFDAATGDELWRFTIAETYKGHDGSHDGPISTPLIDGGRVFGLGPRGHLFALDLETGKAVWTKDLVKEHGATKPHYGFSTSPIVVDGVLVVEMGAGAGKAIAGFDPATGALRWSLGDDEIHYHSPIAATMGGQPQLLAAGNKTLFGVDPRSGKALWSHVHQGDASAMGGMTIIPVPAGDGRFLLMTKNDASSMIQVSRDASEAWQVKELWSNNAIKGSYVIPVYHDGYFFGMTGRIFTCVNAATGETMWRSREPGDGFPTLVGSHIVFITKPGTLHVIPATPDAYHELARLELFGEHSWSAVAYAGGHLFARSMAQLARIDVESGTAAPPGARSWVASTGFGRFLEEAGRASDPKAVVDAWLAKQKSFPIVEPDGSVHFVYRGKAEDVGIVGDMLGSRREDPMTRLAGTDLFHYSIRLEPDAALTYGFIVDYGKAAPDPLNPRAATGLFGDVSWFSMPAWRDRAPAGEADRSRQGRLEPFEWESAAFGNKKRSAQIYLPAGYDGSQDRRYPTFYLFDGKDALEQGGAKNALDHLIPETIEPAIVVFLVPDPENPRRDLGQNEPYADALVKELVPAIDGKYRTRADAGARAAVGLGHAAELALFAGFRNPEVFARIGSLGAGMLSASEFAELIKPADVQPLVIYQGWGTYHLRSPHEAWNMVQSNRDLRVLLRERGHRPAGAESPEGFGWVIWRGRLGEMLGALFPAAR